VGGQLQRGDPPLRPLPQDGDLRRGETQASRDVKVPVGLVVREPQVAGPDLDQLAPYPPSGQRQIGIGAVC
jgi:hypothetical protein